MVLYNAWDSLDQTNIFMDLKNITVLQCVIRRIWATLSVVRQALCWLTALFMDYRYADHKNVSIGALELFTDLGIKYMIIISTQGYANLIFAFLVGSSL